MAVVSVIYLLYFGSDTGIPSGTSVYGSDEVLGVFFDEDDAKKSAEHIFMRPLIWEFESRETHKSPKEWLYTELSDNYWLSIEPYPLGEIDLEMLYIVVPDHLRTQN